MQVTIRGQAIELQFTNRLSRDCDGNCDEPKTQPRKIRVRKSLIGKRKLEVILHEFLHASYWDLDEEAIDTTARDIAAILWKLGYRNDPRT
jgi:hypothetical protein